MAGPEILCVGEILWDSLPGGLFLGGAPLNVARHLHAQGESVGIVSRVGSDRLGEEAIERLAREGMSTDLVEVDAALPTGFVRVLLDGSGVAEYEIVRPVAWDAIELSDLLQAHAAQAKMLVFGTLAQRSMMTRYAVEQLWRTDALKVYDVNLRPPHVDPDTVHRSLGCADVVKLNEHELEQMCAWFGWRGDAEEAAAELARSFGCSVVCMTRGGEGAALWRDGRWSEHPGFEVPVRDTVGAGDAFLATLLAGLRRELPDDELLRRANLMGAWVASRDGAVPPYDRAAIAAVAERTPARARPAMLRSAG